MSQEGNSNSGAPRQSKVIPISLWDHDQLLSKLDIFYGFLGDRAALIPAVPSRRELPPMGFPSGPLVAFFMASPHFSLGAVISYSQGQREATLPTIILLFSWSSLCERQAPSP